MKLALFIHLIAFAIGFGSVMLVDIIGALWVFGKTDKQLVLKMSAIAQKIIWVSVVLLVVSGSILLPDQISARTRIKLAAVVILIINGVLLDRLHKATEAAHQNKFSELPRALQLRSIVLISISQLTWWTAIIIGFLNSSSHVL
jgi:cytochrome bd-type quinol oxidase subunit 2